MSLCVNYLILVMQDERYQHVGKLEKGKVRILYAIFQQLCKVWDHFEKKGKKIILHFKKKNKKNDFLRKKSRPIILFYRWRNFNLYDKGNHT